MSKCYFCGGKTIGRVCFDYNRTKREEYDICTNCSNLSRKFLISLIQTGEKAMTLAQILVHDTVKSVSWNKDKEDITITMMNGESVRISGENLQVQRVKLVEVKKFEEELEDLTS